MISVHLHPSWLYFLRSGNLSKFVAVDSIWRSSRGIITVEIGCAIFHNVGTKLNVKPFIPNSIPLSQLTPQSVFDDPTLTLPALVLGDTAQKANACFGRAVSTDLIFLTVVKPHTANPI
jgi:hypothetical protein